MNKKTKVIGLGHLIWFVCGLFLWAGCRQPPTPDSLTPSLPVVTSVNEATTTLVVQPTTVAVVTSVVTVTQWIPVTVVVPATPVLIGTPLPVPSATSDLTPTLTAIIDSCPIPTDWVSYLVQPGDTLSQLAQRAGISLGDLATANCLSNTNRILVGQTIYLPVFMPTPAPLPTVSSVPNPINLVRFNVSAEQVNVEDTLTVDWKLESAGTIDFISLSIGAAYYENLAREGAISVPVRRTLSGSPDLYIYLYASDYQNPDRSLYQTIIVKVNTTAQIMSFGISPNPAPSNGQVTLFWEVIGSQTVYLSWIPRSNGLTEMLSNEPVAPSGSRTVQLLDTFSPIQFMISITDENGIYSSTSQFLQVTCPYSYFINDPATQGGSCPTGTPQEITAAYQPFERGFMLWDSAEDKIIVLYYDGSTQIFADSWQGGPIEIGETPPVGFYAPVQGFGKVWLDNPDVRSRIGWGTASEQSYTMTKQQMELRDPGSWLLIGDIYCNLPDGRSLRYATYPYTSNNWNFIGQ